MPLFRAIRRLGVLHWASLALPLLGLAVWAHYSWRDALDRATALAEKNVEISREYVLRAVQTAEGAAALADQIVRGLDWTKIATREVHERLKQIDDVSDFRWYIGIVDPAGIQRNSSVKFPINHNLADREYFTALRNGSRTPFVGETILTRGSGLEMIPVARRRSADAFDGVIVANIRVEMLVGFFEKLKIDDQTIASVAREDGMVLARWPPSPPVKLSPDTPYMRAIKLSDRGTYAGIAGIDGVERLYAFARVADDLPLFAVYGFSLRGIRDQWLTSVYAGSAFAVLASIMLLLAASRAGAMQRHRDELSAQVEARTAELKAALVEKNTLLREVHHRVKNNLSMMVALVRLIGRKAPPDSQFYFRDIATRMTAVGKVYSYIHASGDLSTFNGADYLRELCDEISSAFASERFRLRADIAAIDIDIDTAMPLGLIVSELTTNALKHAFTGKESGEVLVRIKQDADQCVLTVRDNGRGLPPEIRPGAAGLGIVGSLVKQIGGVMKHKTRAEGGAQFRITFKAGQNR